MGNGICEMSGAWLFIIGGSSPCQFLRIAALIGTGAGPPVTSA
jgi:hypothetical protein